MPPSRRDIMRQLSRVKTEDLLSFLGDDIILKLAAAYYSHLAAASSESSDIASPAGSESSVASSSQDAPGNNSDDRSKRPLNGFMAFRTYYIKLFPEIQQKSVSGFLTTLWSQDACRNKWALIAKVYSFARDELGKKKVSLVSFLSFACPIMNIISPAAYLNTLGWTVRNTHDGLKLSQDEGIANSMGYLHLKPCPTTELELLDGLLNAGFLPEEGMTLLEKLSSNTNGLMTTTQSQVGVPMPYTVEKLDFVNTIRFDPMMAIRDLIGEGFNNNVIDLQKVRVHRVSEINRIDHLSMQPVYPNPLEFYNFSNANVLDDGVRPAQVEVMPEYDSIDIENPFDLDAALGYPEQEGDRNEDEEPGPDFNSQDDFHYLM